MRHAQITPYTVPSAPHEKRPDPSAPTMMNPSVSSSARRRPMTSPRYPIPTMPITAPANTMPSSVLSAQAGSAKSGVYDGDTALPVSSSGILTPWSAFMISSAIAAHERLYCTEKFATDATKFDFGAAGGAAADFCSIVMMRWFGNSVLNTTSLFIIFIIGFWG